MLRDIRSKVKPEDINMEIRSIRQTRGGEVLLELGKATEGIKAFANAVKTTLEDTGVVKSLVSRVTLELLDLDSITSK